MPTQSTTAIDLAYRPETYFWALDSTIKLSSDIKGAERKALYERAVQSGNTALANALISEPELTSDERTSLGRIHPDFMGGEYLPDRDSEEVEIARITIASTTRDVTSVYAKRGKNRIYYKVVDEYGGDTLNNPTRTSIKPLTLKELTEFFLNSWCLIDCLDCNFESDGYPRSAVHNFVIDASSNFYAEFCTYVRFLINEWLDTKESDDEQ
jgi:hypothetical protein